jgi:hypothetical protein
MHFMKKSTKKKQKCPTMGCDGSGNKNTKYRYLRSSAFGPNTKKGKIFKSKNKPLFLSSIEVRKCLNLIIDRQFFFNRNNI